MSELDVEVARWLVGAEGLTSVADATRLLDEGIDELRVVTRLRSHIDDPRRTSAAVAAGAARRRARNRWPEADRLLFTRESLEQASDPGVATWRARRFDGLPVHDLCSGVGGDAIALARRARSVTAVDRDAARLVLLKHNARVFELDIPTRIDDALAVVVPRDHVVHADPARRREGRRVSDPRRTIPPVDALVTAHHASPGRAFVLAPGTDADHPALGPDVEVEYVQVGHDLVEAVSWSGTLRNSDARASATIIPRLPTGGTDGGLATSHEVGPPGGQVVASDASPLDRTAESGPTTVHRTRSGDRGPLLTVGPVGDHVVEVAASAIRARLHDEIGAEIGARRLARQRALLSVDGEPPTSVWYGARPVLAVLAARTAPVKRWLAAGDRGPMELVLHGFTADPVSWWRELGRPPRGPGGIRIELVRRDDDAIAIVTSDAERA